MPGSRELVGESDIGLRKDTFDGGGGGAVMAEDGRKSSNELMLVLTVDLDRCLAGSVEAKALGRTVRALLSLGFTGVSVP